VADLLDSALELALSYDISVYDACYASHRRPDRQVPDEFVKQVLEAAGLPYGCIRRLPGVFGNPWGGPAIIP
jgi:hypothetical protein